MKITFDYQKTQEGYKLNMTCEEMTRLESGAYDQEEYHDCFKAILKDILNNHLTEVSLPDYDVALQEFGKGFENVLMFGEEAYQIDKEGNPRFITGEELKKLKKDLK